MLELELLLLVYARSLLQASFTKYLDALTELASCFDALDHNNYARWIQIHLRDIAKLVSEHQDVVAQFIACNFTLQKTKTVFSAVPIDQAHNRITRASKGTAEKFDLPTTQVPSAFEWLLDHK